MQTTNNTNYVESVSREVAAVAIEHFGANGSALLCYQDAVALITDGEHLAGAYRALRSLSHSRGVFSTEYLNAEALLLLAILADVEDDEGGLGYTLGQMDRIRRQQDATASYVRQLQAAVQRVAA